MKELCAAWGVDSKEIDKLVEAGAVRPFRRAQGRGSLRLLDEGSLCDVFFAHSFKGLGVRQGFFVKFIEHLRPQYPLLLSQRPERLRVQFFLQHGKEPDNIRPYVVFDTRPLWRCLAVATSAGEEFAQVQRGRPKKDWRAMFRDAVTQLSKQMHENRISDEQIDAAIEAARVNRRTKVDEAVVTVPPP